jgi:Domain of unknown function (DUF5668)
LAELFAIHRAQPVVRRKSVPRCFHTRYREIVIPTGAIVSTDHSYYWRKQLMWGLLLVGLGAAFLLDRLDMFDIDELWHYWPLVLVVFGINKMIGYPSARDFSSGLVSFFIGVWLFATLEGVFGLTFRNSWPFLIIAWGVKLILDPFIERRFASNTESGHEK